MVREMATCCWNILLLFLLIWFPLSQSSDVGDPGSALSNTNTHYFHPDYWIQVEKAIRIARCLKNEVKPVLDVLSLIMKPAACKKYPINPNDCSNCLKAAESFDMGGEATSSHFFANFHRNKNSPKPVFHCNRHVSNQNHDYETHFRLEYSKDGNLPKGLRDEDLPRIFVVEKQVEGIWMSVSIQYYWIFPIETQSDKTYRLRITAVSPEHVYYPVESDPITVYDAQSLTIGTPRNFREVSQKVIRKAARRSPTVMLRWQSGSGLNSSCDFDVYYMDDDQNKVERTKAEDAFWVELGSLQFERRYEVKIIEKFGYSRESGPATNFITVKSCLELEGFNIDLCPPPPPKNLRIENETSGSFFVVWDNFHKSYAILHNFTYTIIIEKMPTGTDPIFKAPQRLFQAIIPGNQTRIEVPSVKGVAKIVIVGTSSGGKSEERSIVYHFKEQPSWTKGLEKIGIVLLIIFLVIMIITFGFYVKSCRNRINRNRQKKEEWKKKWDDEEPLQQTDIYSSKWEIDYTDLALHDVVGRGQFGLVRRATLLSSKTTVAVKTFRVYPENGGLEYGPEDGSLIEKYFQEEFGILKGLEPHMHVVGLVGVVRQPTPALIVEFCDGGDLQTHLRKAASVKMERRRSPCPSAMGSTVHLQPNSEVRVQLIQLNMAHNEAYFTKNAEPCSISPIDLLSYARQVACGMEFLSSNKIIHRDLAARNVLISGKNKILKIADFGLSRDIYMQSMYKKRSNMKIPIKWMAPESLFQEIYNIYSDVWSFGILFWEILTFGASPYPGVDNAELYELLKKGHRLSKPENCSDELYDLMKRCWDDEPCNRPHFTTLRKRIEELIGECSGVNYFNLESAGSSLPIQYSELMLSDS